MTAQQEERLARGRLRGLEKARAARRRNIERQHRAEVTAQRAFRAWLVREREAFTAAQLDRKARRAWLRVLRERPALYGRRDTA